MARRLVLDTGILIACQRAKTSWGDVLEADDDVALAAVSVAETRTGVELANACRGEARGASLQRVLAAIPVESYDAAAAQIHGHGRLPATVQAQGTSGAAHDLIIAATAAATKQDRHGRPPRRFGHLPGVECLQVGRRAQDPTQRRARLGALHDQHVRSGAGPRAGSSTRTHGPYFPNVCWELAGAWRRQRTWSAGRLRPRPSIGSCWPSLLPLPLAIRRYAVNVDQAVAALHSTDEAPVWLARAVAGAHQAVLSADAATSRVTGRSCWIGAADRSGR